MPNQSALMTESPAASFAAQRRLNAICPYYTMFPLVFPERELSDSVPGDAVLDPFCGRGTTLFAARLRGLPAFGIDSDAVAATIARSKLLSATPAEVDAHVELLLAAVLAPKSVPAGEFWELAFHPETLLDICRLRESLLRADPQPLDDIVRALVLGILHGPTSDKVPNYLSNQMLRTYATKPKPAIAYWKKNALKPRHVDLTAALTRRSQHVLDELPPVVSGSVSQADSRELASFVLPMKVSRIVTSPPYLGMRTYRADQWLRHWFLGADPAVDYSTEGMLPPTRKSDFGDGLAAVWKAVSTVATPGAFLSVRFGALPSVKADPEQILRASLTAADVGWKVLSVASAGPSSRGRRQAASMRTKSGAVDEIDLKAQLAPNV